MLVRVVVVDGRLSVDPTGASLAEVLHVIGAEAGFEVFIEGELDRSAPGPITDLPLEEALPRLLDGISFVIVHTRPGSAGSIAELHVYPDATGAVAPARHRPQIRTVDPASPATWIRGRLNAPDRGTRIVAVRRLAELELATALQIAASVLRSESDPVVRGQVAATLGKLEGEAVAGVLWIAADDAYTSVRIHAVNALARVGGERAVETLGRVLLSDRESEVRLAAVAALARIDADQSVRFLELATSDRDVAVRDAASAALERSRSDLGPGGSPMPARDGAPDQGMPYRGNRLFE